MTTVIVILAIAAVLVLVVIGMYNGFVAKRNQADQAFSTIDVMLQKRADLIPNLVATVRQYMKHEEATLTRIAQLRSRMADTHADVGARVQADGELQRLLGGLMIQVEQYPELKSNQNFLRLQESLDGMEEQLSASRRAYNAAVTVYNNAVQMLPGNLLSGYFGFRARALLETPAEDRKRPDVKALFE